MYSPVRRTGSHISPGPIALAMQKKQKSSKNAKKAKNIPAAVVKPFRKMAPEFSSRSLEASDGRILAVNSEFIMDVESSGNGFKVQSLPLNPGIAETFPWLSNIANNYEFYQFVDLSFEYRPACSMITSGSVMLAIDYDAADTLPATKQRLMSYMSAVQGPAYGGLRLASARANMDKAGIQRYTRGHSVPSGKDIKTYDLGQLIVATDTPIGVIGSIYVNYRVRLMTPHSPDVFPWEDSAVISTTTGTPTHPLTGHVTENADATDPIVKDVTPDSFWLRAGEYLLTYTVSGTGLTNVSPATFFTSAVNGFLASVGVSIFNGAVQGMSAIKISMPQNGFVNVTFPAGWLTTTLLQFRFSPYKYHLAL